MSVPSVCALLPDGRVIHADSCPSLSDPLRMLECPAVMAKANARANGGRSIFDQPDTKTTATFVNYNEEQDRLASAEKFRTIAGNVANLVIEKQAAYGDSFSKSGDIMRILYPKGISTEQLSDALTVVRVLDKLFRIATKKDAFGESPWQDVMGYALLELKKAAEK